MASGIELKDRPRILIIENSLDVTGAFNAILYNILDLSSRFCFIFVLPCESANISRVKEHGFEVHTIPMLELRKNMRSVFLYVPVLIINGFKLSRLIKSKDIDIVHSNDIYNLVCVFSRFMTRAKLIVHIRLLSGSLPKWYFAFLKWVHRNVSDCMIAVSKAAKVSWGNVTVIYDPLPSSIQSDYVPSENKEEFKICYLANYTKGKGQDLAIKSLFSLINELEVRNVSLTCAGSDFKRSKNKRYNQELEDLARDLELKGFVQLEGRVDDPDSFYNQFDLALNLSEYESFSYTCLESVLKGLPTICYASGGPEEIIDNGISGVLIKTRKPEAIAREIRDLLQDFDLRKRISANGQKVTREKFSRSSTSGKLQQLYMSLLN